MAATWSPTNKSSALALTSSNFVATGSGGEGQGTATAAITTGQKIWVEVKILITLDNTPGVGLANSSFNVSTDNLWGSPNSIGAYSNGVFSNGSTLSGGFTLNNNDIVNMAVDKAAGTVQYFQNNVSQGTFTHGITGDLFPATDCKDGDSIQIIATGSFTNAAPSGFTEYGATSGVSLSLAATEATDTASFAASLSDSLSLGVTEAKDTAAFSASLKDVASLAATEATDTASFTLTSGAVLSLAATEAADTASISASLSDVASLTASEAQDTAAFALSGATPVTEHFWPFTKPKKRKDDPLERLIAEIEAATQQVPAAPSKELVRAIERREAVKDLQREYTAREVRERIFRILREQQAEQDDEEAFLLLAA